MSTDINFNKFITLNDIINKTDINVINLKNKTTEYYTICGFENFIITDDGDIINKNHNSDIIYDYDKYILEYKKNIIFVLFDDCDENCNILENYDYLNEHISLTRYTDHDISEILTIIMKIFNLNINDIIID